MIVLDTHAWIWWATRDARLSRAALRAIEAADERGLSPVSCYEAARLVVRRRITLDRDVDVWIEQALRRPGVRVLDATPQLLSRAAQLDGAMHGDPFDRIIVATALLHGAPVVTRDDRIRAWGGVRTIW